MERFRRANLEKRKRQRRRRRRIRMAMLFLPIFLAVLLAAWYGFSNAETEVEAAYVLRERELTEEELQALAKAEAEEAEEEEERVLSPEVASFAPGYSVKRTAETETIISEEMTSTYAVLVDVDEGTIVAEREAQAVINPASMTKILTLLVAAEHIGDIDDTFTITQDITAYTYANECSAVGFSNDETVTVRDLLYGTILKSGADAAVGLAVYVAGSHEAFVDMMNEKLDELGLSDTAHFTNCVGLYDEAHHCTVLDMAMILKAAEENDLCREVLGTRIYTTSQTPEHPDGIQISNLFIRRIEDKDTHGLVRGAKTGFVNQSRNCAASYQISNDGGHYICVTGDAHSAWRCIYDHVAIYQMYTK